MTVLDLIQMTELFPNTFLVAALGAADSNLHRAAVSLLGLVVSVLWFACTHEAIAEDFRPHKQLQYKSSRDSAWFSTSAGSRQ